MGNGENILRLGQCGNNCCFDCQRVFSLNSLVMRQDFLICGMVIGFSTALTTSISNVIIQSVKESF